MPSPKCRRPSRTLSPSSTSAPGITVPQTEGLPSPPDHSPRPPHLSPEVSRLPQSPPKGSCCGDKDFPQRESKSPLGFRMLPPSDDPSYSSSTWSSSPPHNLTRDPPPIPHIPSHASQDQHGTSPPSEPFPSTSSTTEIQPHEPLPPAEETPPPVYPNMDHPSTTSSPFTTPPSTHTPSTKRSAPKEWPPPSCSTLLSTEECPQPRSFEWNTLVPAVILAMLAGIVLTWALASRTQQAAMLSTATYTIMLLCLVLPPFFL